MTSRPGGNGQNPGGSGARPGPGAPLVGSGQAGGARPGAGGPPPGGFGPGRRPGGGGGPGMMGMMMPVQKPGNFRASFRRLIERLAPERTLLALVIVLAVVSVAFADRSCASAAFAVMRPATSATPVATPTNAFLIGVSSVSRCQDRRSGTVSR